MQAVFFGGSVKVFKVSKVLKDFKDIKDFFALRYSRYRSSEIVLSLNNMYYCLAITWDANMLAKSLSNLYFSTRNLLIINMRMLRPSIFTTNGNALRTKTLYICNRKGADIRSGTADSMPNIIGKPTTVRYLLRFG